MPTDSHNPNDEALARRIQHGQINALIPLVERHYDPLMGYLFRMTGGDQLLSEDLVQEAFLRVQRNIASYTYPRPFKPWLYAIAINLARNHAASADTRRTLATPEDKSNELYIDEMVRQPEDSLLTEEETLILLDALQRLPEHQREVILLRYTSDMALADIAEALAIPVGTVKSRLSLGLRRLRGLIEEGN